MKLTVGEKLMILRKRAGLNISELGQAAFQDLKAPHIKMKKLEDGTQIPAKEDLERLSRALRIDRILLTDQEAGPVHNGYFISSEVFKLFPKLREYLRFLNSAARIGHRSAIIAAFRKMAEDGELVSENNQS
jgi:hypothetical protein